MFFGVEDLCELTVPCDWTAEGSHGLTALHRSICFQVPFELPTFHAWVKKKGAEFSEELVWLYCRRWLVVALVIICLGASLRSASVSGEVTQTELREATLLLPSRSPRLAAALRGPSIHPLISRRFILLMLQQAGGADDGKLFLCFFPSVFFFFVPQNVGTRASSPECQMEERNSEKWWRRFEIQNLYLNLSAFFLG